MPLYDFHNKETEKLEEHFVSLADYDQFLLDNPHLERAFTKMNIGSMGGGSFLKAAGDGWKEVQDKIKKGLPPKDRGNIRTK